MANFSENRHISNLINMSCKVVYFLKFLRSILSDRIDNSRCRSDQSFYDHHRRTYKYVDSIEAKLLL